MTSMYFKMCGFKHSELKMWTYDLWLYLKLG